ncbi:EF-hand domain-containing protein [Actinophytocola oryzae]|uniref:Ca2+-binding EF-hand superfamily protein n=1 Tax=Actinophytocola oryzae TaxID=502181 RepID=A0A4R7W471_9PSEU|nr:EF-hand domain-containing protein [Actinophytocola oryzae]TDV57500.1 Ca2+-binding EF-hand superfamily protein [Actinophytocola oryzae]
MTTAVQNDRLRQRFQKWDVNGNGVIERSDYEAEALRILQAFGEPPSSPRGRSLMEAYFELFDRMARAVGSAEITEDQFIDYIEEQVFSHGDAGFNRVLRPTISAIVNICDTDGDGEVSPAEFGRWLWAVGVPDAQAVETFRRLDKSGNGRLSSDELVVAVRDFHAGKLDIPLLGDFC